MRANGYECSAPRSREGELHGWPLAVGAGAWEAKGAGHMTRLLTGEEESGSQLEAVHVGRCADHGPGGEEPIVY